MIPTADQILQRCKDIVEGIRPQPTPFEVEERYLKTFMITFKGGWIASIRTDSKNEHNIAVFARLLGMDTTPPRVDFSPLKRAVEVMNHCMQGAIPYDMSAWDAIKDFLSKLEMGVSGPQKPDSTPPEIVLEWVEDEESKGVRFRTDFNEWISAYCYKTRDGWYAVVYFDGTKVDECGISDLENTQSWCLTTITELVTQTKKA